MNVAQLSPVTLSGSNAIKVTNAICNLLITENLNTRGGSARLGHFSFFSGVQTIKNRKTNIVASQYNSLTLLYIFLFVFSKNLYV